MEPTFRLVAPKDATADQLIAYMTAEGPYDFEKTEVELRSMIGTNGSLAALRDLLKQAQVNVIPVVEPVPELAEDPSAGNWVRARNDLRSWETDPDKWRWVLIEIFRKQDAEGRPTRQTVQLGLNGSDINVRPGVPTWITEGYVQRLDDAEEHRLYQDDPDGTIEYSAAGHIPMKVRKQLRYPYQVRTIGGLVRDGPPDARGNEIILCGWGVACERECMELMEKNGLELTRESGGTFARAA